MRPFIGKLVEFIRNGGFLSGGNNLVPQNETQSEYTDYPSFTIAMTGEEVLR